MTEMRDVKVGDRIKFIAHEAPDPAPLEPGAEGTVTEIGPPIYNGERGNVRQIMINWDNGRSLILIEPGDNFEVTP